MGERRPRSPTLALFAGLLVGVAIAGGSMAAFVGATRVDVAASFTFPTTEHVRPALRDLERTLTVAARVAPVAARPVAHPVSGTVTALLVAAGAPVALGEALFRVDGRPVFAAPGDTPYWRPMTVGTTGEDVLQLERDLHAAGYLATEGDEEFTAATERAVARWQHDRGLEQTGVIGPETIVAVPAGHWIVATIERAVGSQVVPGEAVLTIAPAARHLELLLPASRAAEVRPGQPVRWSAPGDVVAGEGTVGPIAAGWTVVDGTAHLLAGVDAGDAHLTSVPVELSLRAVIVTDRRAAVPSIPVGAVRAGADGRPVVVVATGGLLEQRPVSLGLQAGPFVEVVAGLDADETVVVEFG